MQIVVFGELMIDKYFYSITNRMAPEANIPIYKIENSNIKLGGAANVAINLSNLCSVEFVSVIGNNTNLDEIEKILNENNIKFTFFKENRESIIKNRIVCDNKIVNRFDIEDTFIINKNTKDDIYEYINSRISSIDGLVISDYNKGIISTDLCINLINLCNKYSIKTFIDPKINDINKYKNCTLLKPNYKEALLMLNVDDCISNEELAKKLFEKIGCKYLLITNGEFGMFGYSNDYIEIKHDSKIDVIDVTGAGDVVISILTYIFLLTNDFVCSIRIANYVAGKSVKSIGNYKFSIKDIKEYFKVIYSNQTSLISNISKIHKNIVFTNGCFDIVHIGHLKLLNFAKSKGDVLILGINSDSSIKKIKGDSRPINNEKDRIEFLFLLNIVDYIIIFDEETPYNIIKNLKPKVLIKGGDYKIENVVGREFADEVILYDLVPDKSTSLIINRIKN